LTTIQEHYTTAPSTQAFAQHYLTYLSELLSQLNVEVIEQTINVFSKAAEQGSTVYFIGNGGSAATASHFACDMRLNTRAAGFPALRAVSLADNVATLTALGNDEGFDNIFYSQLDGVLQPEDVVVALSVSGNSPNIVKAVQFAKQVGALTIGFTGFDGGSLYKLADIRLHVPTPPGEYGPVEDIAMILDHLIYTYLRLSRRGEL